MASTGEEWERRSRAMKQVARQSWDDPVIAQRRWRATIIGLVRAYGTRHPDDRAMASALSNALVQGRQGAREQS